MSGIFIKNQDLYKRVIEPISEAKSFVWIGTADLKDMHVYKNNSNQVESFLAMLNRLLQKKIEVRLLHAKEPGINFRTSFDKYPMLYKKLERKLCPRVHFKQIIIDDNFAYMGSANLTGAGLGIKSSDTRNFESGIITTDHKMIDSIIQQFDSVWQGEFCKSCKRKAYCPDPIL